MAIPMSEYTDNQVKDRDKRKVPIEIVGPIDESLEETEHLSIEGKSQIDIFRDKHVTWKNFFRFTDWYSRNFFKIIYGTIHFLKSVIQSLQVDPKALDNLNNVGTSQDTQEDEEEESGEEVEYEYVEVKKVPKRAKKIIKKQKQKKKKQEKPKEKSGMQQVQDYEKQLRDMGI